MRGLLDTSVFIADEQGRPLASDRLPDEAAVSVVTFAELELGVHLAGSEAVRARRLRTLQSTRSTYVGLPVDEAVASAFAEVVAVARRAGGRPKIQDAWIAATARALDVRRLHPGQRLRRVDSGRRPGLNSDAHPPLCDTGCHYQMSGTP